MRSRRWAVAAQLAVMCFAVAGCSSTTSATSPTSTASTDAATSTTSAAEPGLLFPDQAVLPVMVYVNGVVYDLAETPARQVAHIGQSALPYAGSPIATEHGLLAATGAGYDATLLLYPGDARDPLVLAHGVGSFALSEDGSRLAWAEPFQGPSGDAVETTRLVEAEFPSGRVIHSMTFLGFNLLDSTTTPRGFADVVAYVGDNVLVMTGDGAAATAAVWIPAADEVAAALHYNTGGTGNSAGGRVVLWQNDGSCGQLVSIAADGSVVPRGERLGNDGVGCWASEAATFSPDGSMIASAGTDGEAGPPILLLTASSGGRELARVAIPGFSGGYFQPYTIEWLDNETLVLLATEGSTASWALPWSIHRCDTQALACDLAQSIAFSPTGFYQVALVAAP